MPAPVVIKKYGNRRLYDTQDSRYLTMEELAQKIRSGTDVQVVEAKTGADLTQATLTQIVIESRGAAQLLPVPLLTQMIRLGDDALAEFLGQYMTGAMELYIRTKRGMQALSPFAGMGGSLPFPAEAFARFFANPFQQAWGGMQRNTPMPHEPDLGPPPATPAPADRPMTADQEELASLRKEIEDLKTVVSKSGKTRKKR